MARIINERDSLVVGKFDRIEYYAKFYSSLPESLRNNKLVTFKENLPAEEVLNNDAKDSVLICLDDLMDESFNSPVISRLFSQGRNKGKLFSFE